MSANQCYTLAEVQKLTTLSRSKLWQLMRTGELAARHVGNRVLITDEALSRFIEGVSE